MLILIIKLEIIFTFYKKYTLIKIQLIIYVISINFLKFHKITCFII